MNVNYKNLSSEILAHYIIVKARANLTLQFHRTSCVDKLQLQSKWYRIFLKLAVNKTHCNVKCETWNTFK